MLKQAIALVAVSIAVILTMTYAQQGLNLLLSAHDWISDILTNVFSGGQAGNIARGLIALLSIPVLVGLVPAIIYWLVRHKWFPYFMEIVWIVWLVQAGALIVMYKVVG
jgi:hypothetical protein